MKSIIMGTGNYQNVKTGNTLSIDNDGGKNFGYKGKIYSKLAPLPITYDSYVKKCSEILTLDDYLKQKKKIEDEFIKSYFETRFKYVDIEELLFRINKRYGSNIILLSSEPVDEFSHRRLIADYIELETGSYIPEVSIDETGNVKKLTPIRYKRRIDKIMYR